MMDQWITQIQQTSGPTLIVFAIILAGLGIWLMAINRHWQHKLDQKVRELNGVKQAANQVKSLFIANISHEIRTPLNAILGHAQLMTRDRDLDQRYHHNISNILNSSEHLSELINDLLEMASIESNSMTLTTKDFDLSDMLSGLSKLFDKRCSQKGLTWVLKGDVNHPQHVSGDMGKIRQILVKLTNNAVKFTDSGNVELSLERKQNCYKFSIKDTGIGISLRQQQHIYDAFSRQKQCQPGVGLGLVIAKTQIELMGGTLQLESTPGNGSRFSFTLILPKAKGQVHQRTIRGRKVVRLATKNNAFAVRVLVIDRNIQTQSVLTQMLTDVGIVASQAKDGEEALRLLVNLPENQLPKLVFYDIDVPLMTDSEQLARMRETFSQTDMQFVVLSASGIQTQIKQHICRDEGDNFTNFIAKPYRFEAIYEVIHGLLGIGFEYQDKPPPIQKQTLDYKTCRLPEQLYFDMRTAAGDYEIAKLEQSLNELKRHSPQNSQLSHHLTTYLSQYDMEGLLGELEKVQREPI